ncbi:MAG: hypothetical protein IT233_12665 [Bacteroidia bacterium]|nr:hypothetical protein [Bacteroidia bacterium]
MITEETKFTLKPYMKKELAKMYNMSPRAFNSFIRDFEDEIGKKKGRYYTVKQVERLIKCVGMPRTVKVDKRSEEIEFLTLN